MALQKQGVTLNFAQGLDTKTDSNQLAFGKFTSLVNSVFDKLLLLKKRNGFPLLAQTNGSTSFLTTYAGDLLAIGDNIQAYNPSLSSFLTSAPVTSVHLSTVPLVNNMYNQSGVDSAIAPNGLLCTTFSQSDTIPNGSFKYVISNPLTGQTIAGPKNVSIGSQHFSSRVFCLNSDFVILYDQSNAANSTSSLNALFIPSSNPLSVGSVSIVTNSMASNSTLGFDATIASSSLYIFWNKPSSAGISAAYYNPSFTLSSPVSIGSTSGRTVNVVSDHTGPGPTLWSLVSDPTSAILTYVATDGNLTKLFPEQSISSVSLITNVTGTAKFGILTAYVETNNHYSYDTSIRTDHIYKFDVSNIGQVLGSMSLISRCQGIASKGFIVNSNSYFLGVYQSTYQSTYFLLNSTGGVVSKLNYGNAGGYVTTGLSSVNVVGSTASVPYLNQNFITPVNKVTNSSPPVQTSGIYSQTGINYATHNFSNSALLTKEVGGSLQFNGGFLGMYDGSQFVENNFFLYPDYIEVFAAASGGSLSAQTYYYQVIYEWIDGKGLLQRSAPSIPVNVVATTSSSAITINIPTPRVTLKTTSNPIRVGTYRWSTAQQTYYKISPSIVMDNLALSADYLTVQDTVADSSIIGNEILYTNGGVVLENTNGPGSSAMTIFDNRLFMVSGEDPNTVWYSKQLIEKVPVEMSDFLTLFVSPSIGAEGPTGDLKCLFPMDDKLILFKKDSIYYINGSGPDDTGANSQYSQPIFITSSVGCSNQNSIVLIPGGLMFQSDKGIWLLGRDLSTQYIGKDVESYNSSTVLSSLTVPGTNQARFHLNTGEILLFDYFVGQWGTFDGVAGISSTLYNSNHTFVDNSGNVLSENANSYLDNGTPVTMSFTTGWISAAGLEGYKRLYRAYLLANYLSPHDFTVGVAYNYDPTITQTITVTADSSKSLEQWQLNFINQQCQSFQLTFTEVYTGTPGAGLTLSGLRLVFGVKSEFPQNIPASQRKS